MSARPRAVVAAPHVWDGPIQVGGHHFARAFARLGWDVLYLADPVSPPHILAGMAAPRLRPRLGAALAGPRRDAESGILSALPFTLAPLAGRLGAGNACLVASWPRFTLPPLHGLVERHGFAAPDLFFFDGALPAALIDMLRPRASVMRLFDRPSAMPGTNDVLMEAMRQAARRVDAVVYSAATLHEDAEALGARAAWHLPNGVDAARFAAPRPEPEALARLRRPRIVYVGAMEDWFDAGLVSRLAGARPDWDIVLIGDAGRARLTDRPNLHRLGPVPWAALPAHLQHCDAGIIPFAVSGRRALVDAINPLKLYEYMAAGLPVVATRWAELERLASPARLADDATGFIAALDAVLAEPTPREALSRFAQEADWSRRAEALLGRLGLA